MASRGPARVKPARVSPVARMDGGGVWGEDGSAAGSVTAMWSRKAALWVPSDTSIRTGRTGTSSQPRVMPSRSLRTPSTTSKRHSSSGVKEKWNGPAVSGSVTERTPMVAPISPAATVPPLAKKREVGAVSSRSSTARRSGAPAPFSPRVPSLKTNWRAISISGSAARRAEAFEIEAGVRADGGDAERGVPGGGEVGRHRPRRLDPGEERQVAFQMQVGDPVGGTAAFGDARGCAAPVPDHRHLLPPPCPTAGMFCRGDERRVKMAGGRDFTVL